MAEAKENFTNRLMQQRKIGVGLLLLSLLSYIIAYVLFPPLLAYSWLFGLALGFILQRSRICFTAAIRDPLLFGLTELSRGLILSLAVSSIGYAVIQYYRVSQGLSLVGKFIPLGWHIPIGAFVFGLGAAISGGCASGTLMRIGEGFQMQLVVIIGFLIGSTHGTYDARWWYNLIGDYELSHLPTIIGWRLALVVQFGLLFILYLLAYWWEEYRFGD
ncbi:MAG: YeeE/YedE thiosulfate transporter family protein [Bacillota bacterium]